MCRRSWLLSSGNLALALALGAAACDRLDPVDLDSRTAGRRPAATVVPTPGGDLSITTVALQVPAGRRGVAADVNGAGVIVGYYEHPFTTDPNVPVRWDLAGTMTPLPLPTVCAGGYADARSVNEAGDIVGGCAVHVDGELVNYAILWPKGGTPVVLALPPGTTEAGASDVNNKGEVVGGASTAGGGLVPVLWSKGQAQLLALPSGYEEGFASRINNGGLIAGHNVGSPARVFVWDKGVPQLQPLAPGWTASSMAAINSAGVLVGTLTRMSPYETLPTKWDRLGNATAVVIDRPEDAPVLYDVSNGGWIIGNYGACITCPFLWSEATGTVPLSFPGVSPAHAIAISDPGYIVGDRASDSLGSALLWIVTLTPTITP